MLKTFCEVCHMCRPFDYTSSTPRWWGHRHQFYPTHPSPSQLEKLCNKVQDGPKLLDDDGEIPKFSRKRLVIRILTMKSPLYLTDTCQVVKLPPMLWRCHVGLLSRKRRRSSTIPCTIPLGVSPFHFERFGWAYNSSIWLVVVVVSSNIWGKVLLADPSSTIQLSKLTNVKILQVCSSSFWA